MTDIGTEIDNMEGIFMIDEDTLLITLIMKQYVTIQNTRSIQSIKEN